jgi:hypothetical protein
MGDYESLLESSTLATDFTGKPRIVVGIDALDKAGKTRLAFDCPKPVVYFNLDVGEEGVIEKQADPRIIMLDPFVFRVSEALFLERQGGNTLAAEKIVIEKATPELDRFRRSYYKALREPVLQAGGKSGRARKLYAKTIIMDTGSEVYELVRLVELGKLSQVKSHHYGAVNAMMRDMVRAGLDSEVNVIWLHKLKSEWKAGGQEGKQAKTGVLERKGFEEMNYLVQANILMYRAPRVGAPAQVWKWKSGEGGVVEFQADPRRDDQDLGFRLLFGNSRFDPTLEGTQLENERITFKEVAAIVAPTVDPAAWEDAV